MAGIVIVAWLLATPAGLLGKADAIGYAVCHRIDLRSFHLGERPLPLCARCTGLYLGALLPLVGFQVAGRARHGAFPGTLVLAALLVFGAAFAVDGLNSYFSLFPGLPHLYQPSNVLRLTTGLLAGIAVGAFVHSGFQQNVWKDWRAEPALRVRDLGWLLAAAAGVAALVLSDNTLILYPLALVSAAGVILVLTSVYTVLVLLVTGRENRAVAWSELWLPGAVGLGLALVQVGAIDLVRYALTGTWAGFTF